MYQEEYVSAKLKCNNIGHTVKMTMYYMLSSLYMWGWDRNIHALTICRGSYCGAWGDFACMACTTSRGGLVACHPKSFFFLFWGEF